MTHNQATEGTLRTATMRAVVGDRYGSPEEVLRLTDLPVPEIGPQDVLLRVQASSVNALDWHYVTGTPLFARVMMGLRRPKRAVPGADVAGTVVARGSEVTCLEVGDKVFGEVGGGGFAEYVAAPADWLVKTPARLSQEEASTLGVAALTALQGLRDWGGLQAGQRVLVIGASGGVGTFAVQLAKALGASHVTAVCSTANTEIVARLGADRVIDYTHENPVDIGEQFDLVFDNAGVAPLRRCRELLAPGGVYVMITAKKSRALHPLPRMLFGTAYFNLARERAAIGRVAERSTPDLEVLAKFVEEGRLTPVMDRRYRLDEGPEAVRRQGEFHNHGKSIVVMDPADADNRGGGVG